MIQFSSFREVTRATLSVSAYARHIYCQLESAVGFEQHKVT